MVATDDSKTCWRSPSVQRAQADATNWRVRSNTISVPQNQKPRSRSTPNSPETSHRTRSASAASATGKPAAAQCSPLQRTRKFLLTPVRSQNVRARSADRGTTHSGKSGKSWNHLWTSPDHKLDSITPTGKLESTKPTGPILSGTRPYGCGGPGGNLELRAAEFFERAYGLNGRTAENHYNLMQIVKTQVQCSDRAVQELFYGFSYSDKLEKLRAQVRLYPRRPDVVGNKNREKAKRIEELDALARILDPDYKSRPVACKTPVLPQSPPLPHRMLLANQGQKQSHPKRQSSLKTVFGQLPFDDVVLLDA